MSDIKILDMLATVCELPPGTDVEQHKELVRKIKSDCGAAADGIYILEKFGMFKTATGQRRWVEDLDIILMELGGCATDPASLFLRLLYADFGPTPVIMWSDEDASGLTAAKEVLGGMRVIEEARVKLSHMEWVSTERIIAEAGAAKARDLRVRLPNTAAAQVANVASWFEAKGYSALAAKARHMVETRTTYTMQNATYAVGGEVKLLDAVMRQVARHEFRHPRFADTERLGGR